MPRTQNVSNMNLLPEDLSEFRSKEYWDSFFKKRQNLPFEWYGEWIQLQRIFAEVCSQKDDILVVGCGNSELSANMYDAGYVRVTNVDFSRVVIMEMLKKHVRARPQMRWLLMDITKMTFKNETFDVVMDKGGLDALMGEPGEESTAAGDRMLNEVARVLRSEGGRYLCITLAQEHVLEMLLQRLRYGWTIAIYRIPMLPGERSAALQPFLVVSTRIAAPPSGSVPPVTISFSRLASDALDSDQMAAICEVVDAENERRRSGSFPPESPLSASVPDDLAALSPGRSIAVQLAPEGPSQSPRYSATILDAKAGSGPHPHQCAVFLVPQGREHEWLFAAEEGRWQLLESAGAARLVLVNLNRSHVFGTSAEVQAELSPLVLRLAPANCREGRVPIPFMTTHDDIGKRVLLEEVESPLSGGLLVEDVELTPNDPSSGRSKLRRLVFKRSLNLIQSEAAFKTDEGGVRKQKGGVKKTPEGSESVEEHGTSSYRGSTQSSGEGNLPEAIDHSYLASDYHIAMIAGLTLLAPQLAEIVETNAEAATMLIGLGGGALPMFMRRHLPFLRTTVVELDPVVVGLAKRHFGFLPDSHLQVEVGDGLKAVESLASIAAQQWEEGPAGEALKGSHGGVDCHGQSPPLTGEEAGRIESRLAKLKLGENGSSAQSQGQGPKLQVADPRLHLLIVDADSDDLERSGLSCPPPAFLRGPFLRAAREAVRPEGALALNVVARSAGPYAAAIAALAEVFDEVYELDVDEDVNRVLFALPKPSRVSLKDEELRSATGTLAALVVQHFPWSQVSLIAKYGDSIRLVGHKGVALNQQPTR